MRTAYLLLRVDVRSAVCLHLIQVGHNGHVVWSDARKQKEGVTLKSAYFLFSQLPLGDKAKAQNHVILTTTLTKSI